MRLQIRSLIFLLFALAASGQWKKLSVPTTAGLRGLSVVSAGVVWASGTDGTVIRTIDGGNHWSVMIVPGAEKLDFRGIHAFDAQNAVIISSGLAEKGQARIYRTTDGGATWKQVLDEKRAGIFFDAVAFWDRKHGIVLSDPVDGKFVLVTTNDGGETWRQIPPGALPPALPKEGAFAASNSCLTVAGKSSVWFGTGSARVARVFYSRDRGKTWTVSDTPMHPENQSSGIFSLYFGGVKSGIAAGGDYAHPDSFNQPNLLFTNDRGKTWQALVDSGVSRRYLSSALQFWSPGKDSIAVVGSGGGWLAMGGGDWVQEMNENLNTVVATPERSPTMWAVGPKGTVMRLRIWYDHGGHRRSR